MKENRIMKGIADDKNENKAEIKGNVKKVMQKIEIEVDKDKDVIEIGSIGRFEQEIERLILLKIAEKQTRTKIADYSSSVGVETIERSKTTGK